MQNATKGTRSRVFNHSPGLWDRAAAAADKSEGVVCVVLAAASVEALAHDLVAYLGFLEAHELICLNNSKNRKSNHIASCSSDVGHSLTKDERSLLNALRKLEGDRASSITQLQAIWNTPKSQWDDNHPLIKDLKLLIGIRNAVAHPKPELTERQLRNGLQRGPIKGYPSFLDLLVSKKLVEKPDGSSSWLNSLDTKDKTKPTEANQFSNWVMRTTRDFIEETTALLPDTMICRAFKKEAVLM